MDWKRHPRNPAGSRVSRRARGDRRSARRAAFTLVELMIVVIILGILAAIVVPQLTEGGVDARFSALSQNLAVVRKQIGLYKLQHNGALPNLVQFTAQMTGKTDAGGAPNPGGAYGPYLERIPKNPFTIGGTGDDVTADAAGVSKAWYYDETTGDFRANDGGATRGITHDSM